MGLINEETEEPQNLEKFTGSTPSAIYAKLPVYSIYGQHSFELQSDENYTFDGEYKYYLLVTVIKDSYFGNLPPDYKRLNYYGITTGTYILYKIKDNSEIFEGKPFEVVQIGGRGYHPENKTWDELLNDAKTWSIDTYFEGKDSLLKSIYEETSNFLTPTSKKLTYSTLGSEGWSYTETGKLKDITRFEKIPEVKNGAEYMLDFNIDSKMTFFVRTPRLIRLIPIWDGSQVTFKKSNGTEKVGEIINNSSEDVVKTNENRIKNGKNLLYEGVDLDGKCVEGDCVNGKGTFEFTNGDKYVGEFKDGKIDGQGTLYIKIGYEYVGEWKDGKWDGQGTLTKYYEYVYEGEFKDHARNGKGTLTYYDGGKYSGDLWAKYSGVFKDDYLNGQGTVTWGNGDVYVGNLKDPGLQGFPDYDGQGTLSYPDGEKYFGEWKDGKLNGYGTKIWSDGSKYVGEWKDGNFNGYGTFTVLGTSKGDVVYVGNWNGDLEGQGTETLSNGSKYVGEWKKFKKNGQGTQTWGDGSKYVGEWEDNMMDGQGTYTNKEGKEFTGIWVNNTLNGKIIRIDDKLFLPTRFELIADDIYYNLIREKIPNVTIVSEPTILEQNEYLTKCWVNIKIGTKEYIAIFSEDGLLLVDEVSDKYVKAVWDNKNLTVRPFTSQEIKDANKDDRLYYDVQLLGGDKFQMSEILSRFKQLIK